MYDLDLDQVPYIFIELLPVYNESTVHVVGTRPKTLHRILT